MVNIIDRILFIVLSFVFTPQVPVSVTGGRDRIRLLSQEISFAVMIILTLLDLNEPTPGSRSGEPKPVIFARDFSTTKGEDCNENSLINSNFED